MFVVIVLQLKSACLLLEWQADDKAMFFGLHGRAACLRFSRHFKTFFVVACVFCVPDSVTAHGQALDAFIELADRTMGKPELILGSCQLAAMVGDLKVPPSLFHLTLASLFEDQDAVDRALQDAEYEQHRMMTRRFAIVLSCKCFFCLAKGKHHVRRKRRGFWKQRIKLCQSATLRAAGGSKKASFQCKRLGHHHLVRLVLARGSSVGAMVVAVLLRASPAK